MAFTHSSPPLTRNHPPRPLPPHLPMMTQINANWISDEAHYRKEDPCLELQREVIDGHSLLILQRIDKRYLRYFVGVEMARLLRQQTYNMYRSMKSRGIELIRANQNVLSYLRQQKAVPRNTHSVTLVPYAEGMKFILERLRERQKIEKQNQVALGLLSSATNGTTSPTPTPHKHPKSITPPPTAPSASHFSSFPVTSGTDYRLQSRDSRSLSPPNASSYQSFASPPTPIAPSPQQHHFKTTSFSSPNEQLSSLRSLSEVSMSAVVSRRHQHQLQHDELPRPLTPQLPHHKQTKPVAPLPPAPKKVEDPSRRRGEELKSGGWLQLLLNSTTED